MFLYISWVCTVDVTEHFVFPSKVSHYHDCFVHEELILQMFTVGESRAISHVNDTQNQA